MVVPSCLVRMPADLKAGILDALAALGRSLDAEVDPQHFLDEFSVLIRTWIPHDRLVVCTLSEDARSFTILAEKTGPLGGVHAEHYTSAMSPTARHPVGEHGIAPVFLQGESMVSNDLQHDPRFQRARAEGARYLDPRLGSGMAVPLQHGGRIVGCLIASSLARDVHSEDRIPLFGCLADVVAPFIHGAVLLQRDATRRRRLEGVEKLTADIAGTLDVAEAFRRIDRKVSEAIECDAFGAVALSADGTEIVSLAEVDHVQPDIPPPERLPADSFSLAQRVFGGEIAIVEDAPVELDRRLAGDRWIVDSGARSALCAPLWIGEQVGGVLYFAKRQPRWYDSSDREIARAVALRVSLLVQHQRLAAEQRRAAATEQQARKLQKRLEDLQSQLDARFGFERIHGRHPLLRAALEKASKVAQTETTVLITGESGTGKELVAHAIHLNSARRGGPFVALNCAALPESLLESELFGHERGAFTGADRARAGRIEAAAGGTLFLDEVGELATSAQAKLLRVLQEREFTRVGGRTTLKADVRILAATNRDLSAEVAAGRFREDLYYRLAVFAVHLPPLRERGEDVLLLAESFLQELEGRMGKGIAGFSREARQALVAYSWPGNIRELSNAIERAMILSDGGLILPEQLGLPSAPPIPVLAGPSEGPDLSIPQIERRLVLEALTQSGGNRSHAAKLLGLSRSQLYTRLKRFGISA